MKNILLVEDSPEIVPMVQSGLSAIAQIHWVDTVAKAKEALENENFDLYILDMELPDGKGVDLCSSIQRKATSSSIFFLTSHTELSDKIFGFAAGADDYITKPFEPLELKARVEAAFRKKVLVEKQSTFLEWEQIQINTLTQEVKIKENGHWTPIELTSLEYKLLMYFAARPNHVVSRDDILDEIWGKDVHVYPRSVDTHVSKLRKKLATMSGLVDSVHGTGYRFMPDEKNH